MTIQELKKIRKEIEAAMNNSKDDDDRFNILLRATGICYTHDIDYVVNIIKGKWKLIFKI